MPGDPRSQRTRSFSAPADGPGPGGLRGYLSRRVDPLTSVFLVLPQYLIYQLGVLLRMQCTADGACSGTRNGADFLTDTLLPFVGGSRFTMALLALGVGALLAGAALYARRSAKLHPRMFVPVIVEGAVYASLVGPISVGLQHAIGLGARHGETFLDDVVASCGAGLHEELIFRAGLFAGGLWLLRRTRLRPWFAMAIALSVSSVLFSLVHHLGPMGEPFTVRAFVFRVFAGALFGVIFRVRGFAIAAWTHAVYDIWVMGLSRFGF